MHHRYFQALGIAAPFILLTAFIGGCALPALLSSGFVPPEITLEESKVESMSLSVATVSFGINISNPNPYPVSVRNVRYRILVGGSAVATGDAPGATLSAHGSGTIDLPAEIQLDALAAAAPGARMLGEIPYELDASLSVRTLLSRREFHFVDAGVMRLDLPMGLASARDRFAFTHTDWQT